MKNTLALLRFILCIAGPIAIWLSWRWTGAASGPAPFDGFVAAARALAAFGASAFIIASVIAAARITGDTLIARLARAFHAGAWLVLYILMIGPVAHILAPVLAIGATQIHHLLRPSARDGLSPRGNPIAVIGQTLSVTASGLPLLAAPLGWIGSDIALMVWIVVLWLAAAFKLHHFLPRRMAD